jgi:hypothetical protein
MERFKTVKQLKKKLDRLERTESLQKQLSKKEGLQVGKILALSTAILTGLIFLIKG